MDDADDHLRGHMPEKALEHFKAMKAALDLEVTAVFAVFIHTFDDGSRQPLITAHGNDTGDFIGATAAMMAVTIDALGECPCPICPQVIDVLKRATSELDALLGFSNKPTFN